MSQLKKLLDELGTTHKQVAKKLEKLGCKGHPEDGFNCPIANYLQQSGYTCVHVDVNCIETKEEDLKPSEVINNFIYKFDEGKYPNLIEENDE